jgi:hypothetical protein
MPETAQEIKETEVLYSEGATPLFLAIEETDWRQALDIAEAHPEQVRTWVRSTGTENTTFTWSMWRRLPIHEVVTPVSVCHVVFCRRRSHRHDVPLFPFLDNFVFE